MKLDDTDKRILNRIQSRFPITSRPFKALADDLGLNEDDVMARIARLKETDIIRRIGGNFVPEKVGFVSTLCAAKVPPEQIDVFAAAVNRYAGVTHNYLRDNAYNVWFTFIASSREEIEQNLVCIARETGISEIMNLPATRVYKIKAKFRV